MTDPGPQMQKMSIVSIVRYSGIYIGAVIGAGFASGQESLLFFSGYGLVGIAGAVVAMLLFTWYGTLFMTLGHDLQTTSHQIVLRSLCGKFLGSVFDWILTFFLFGVLAIMISGGGAALNQHFGISLVVGKLIIAVAAMVTVILGFSSALKMLGFLSPLMIIAIIAISIVTLAKHFDGLAAANAALPAANVHTPTPYWWTSALIYVSYCVLPTIPALAAIGLREQSRKIVKRSGIVGGLALGTSLVLMILATLSILSVVARYQIPFLEVAKQMGSWVALVFVFVLLAAVYTTAVPILYGFAARFATSGTVRFKLLTVLTTLVAFVAGLFQFNTLVGTVYPLLGYVGLVVMGFGLYYTVMRLKSRPKSAVAGSDVNF